MNKHPATPPPPLQSSAPRLVGVERFYELELTGVSTAAHAYTCVSAHAHTCACSIHSTVALDASCLCTGGRSCTHGPVAAAALCARHTPPHEEARTTAAGGEVLTPTSRLSPLGWDRALQLMAMAFLLHSLPVRLTSWAEALVLQMGKLRLREGTHLGLYSLFLPIPPPTQRFKEATGPEELGEKSERHWEPQR